MLIKASNWLAAGLLGSVLTLSLIASAAEKSDMMKDEKAGMMKEEKEKMKEQKSDLMKEKAGMMKDAKGMTKDQMKEMKAKGADDKMKMDKMEEKK